MKHLPNLLALLTLLTLGTACTTPQRGDDVASASHAIQSLALKQNPGLRGQRLRVGGVIDSAGSDGVCACLKVCDGNGENCTACSCSPANCGSCD